MRRRLDRSLPQTRGPAGDGETAHRSAACIDNESDESMQKYQDDMLYRVHFQAKTHGFSFQPENRMPSMHPSFGQGLYRLTEIVYAEARLNIYSLSTSGHLSGPVSLQYHL